MSPVVALFVGGPWDGQVHALRDATHVVHVAEPVDPVVAFRADADPTAEVSIKRTVYVREKVVLFGRAIPVWVHESVTRWTRDDAVARHLLSPLAKGIGGFQS